MPPAVFVDWLVRQRVRKDDSVGFLAEFYHRKMPEWSKVQQEFAEELALAEQEFAACRGSEEKGGWGEKDLRCHAKDLRGSGSSS